MAEAQLDAIRRHYEQHGAGAPILYTYGSSDRNQGGRVSRSSIGPYLASAVRQRS